MADDAASAQRTRDDARRTVGSSPHAAQHGQLEESNPLHVHDVGGGQRTGMAMSGDAAGAADRKAEYARQLREQMASDKVIKRAADDGEKGISMVTMSTPRSSGIMYNDSIDVGGGGRVTEGDGGGGGGDSTKTIFSKAEYARQLREQMAAKESARLIEGQRARSPSANAGPSWLEGATEGRERHRRDSKAEYAEQLRAQISRRSNGQRKASAPSRESLGARGDPRQSVYDRGEEGGWSHGHGGRVAGEIQPEQELRRDFSQDGRRRGVVEYGERGRREEGGRETITPHRSPPQDPLALER